MKFFIVFTAIGGKKLTFYNQLFDSYKSAAQKISEWSKSPLPSTSKIFLILPYYKNPFYNFEFSRHQWLNYDSYFKKGMC